MNKKILLPILFISLLLLSIFSVSAYRYGYNYAPQQYSNYYSTSVYEKSYNSDYSYTRYNYGGPTYRVDWGPNPSANYYYGGYHPSHYGGYYNTYSGFNSQSSYSYSRNSYNSYNGNYYTRYY